MNDEQYTARLTEIVEEIWGRGYDDCDGDTWQYDADTGTITHPPKSEIIHDFVTEIIEATSAANPERATMTAPKIDNAINSLAGAVSVATTAMVNLHYAATSDPDQIVYAIADLRDLRASINQTLELLGATEQPA